MAKKTPKIKFTGTKPDGTLLKAKLPDTVVASGVTKIALNHRASAIIETDLKVAVDTGYRLCFRLVPDLTNRGIVATNAPGFFMNGQVTANLLNVGREIVEIKSGDPLMHVWIEEDLSPVWEKLEE